MGRVNVETYHTGRTFSIILSCLFTLATVCAQEHELVQASSQTTQPVSAKDISKAPTQPEASGPTVRIVGIKTDVAKRYSTVVPALPFPPFTGWRRWFREHLEAVHCALEWRTEKGEWFHGELRSTHFQENSETFRVGYGEFPGTAYDAYGIYIIPGRVERDKDDNGQPMVVTLDEEVKCDYHQVEEQIRQYGAKDRTPGTPGTGGTGKTNVGLGGPAYKPAQNSNTMVKYILRHCGLEMKSPDLAVGWDREPTFPYSSNADAPATDNQP